MKFELANTVSGELTLIPPTGSEFLLFCRWEEELSNSRFFAQHGRFISCTKRNDYAYARLAEFVMVWCAANEYSLTIAPEVLRLLVNNPQT